MDSHYHVVVPIKQESDTISHFFIPQLASISNDSTFFCINIITRK